MRSTRRNFVLLSAVVSTTLVACSSDTSESSSPPSIPSTTIEAESAVTREQLSTILTDHLSAGEFVGARLAFRGSDDTTAEIASGTQTTDADSAPVVPDIPWGIGSITKTFLAVVTLQLAEDGLLDLDAGIDEYFPDLADADRITPRQLLQHTSGLGDYFDKPAVLADDQRPWTPSELIAIAEADGRLDEPGVAYHYSNTGYVILGEIIEQVTGRPWLDEVDGRIVQPLGLQHTGLIDATSPPGYDPIDGAFVANHRKDPSIGGAAGSLEGTTDDLLRFVAALADGTLLTRQSMQHMRTFVPGEDLSQFGIVHSSGLGLERYETDDITVYGHLGSSDAHSAFIGFDGAGNAVAVGINSQAPGPQAFIAIETLTAAGRT